MSPSPCATPECASPVMPLRCESRIDRATGVHQVCQLLHVRTFGLPPGARVAAHEAGEPLWITVQDLLWHVVAVRLRRLEVDPAEEEDQVDAIVRCRLFERAVPGVAVPDDQRP